MYKTEEVTADSTITLPRNCTFTQNDWKALAPFWDPVAFSHEITDKPYGTRLLDERIVLFRLKSGSVVAAQDICLHDFNHQVFAEDKAIVEQQYLEDLPLALQDEVHIAGDKSSIAYRKGLAKLGLGRSFTA